MHTAIYDLLVIGAGINGAGIARDAAGRGLNVLLCEQGDVAQATSSASTKLLHGGLRYLEHFEFRLVREALQERERLLRLAPHIAAPLKFVLPYDRGMRPAVMIRLGLFLYDHLARRSVLPASAAVDLRGSPLGAPLQPQFATGFLFWDGCVDDSRLVVLNAMQARDLGAQIRTRTQLLKAWPQSGEWRASLLDLNTGKVAVGRARAIVNAAGPFVNEVSEHRLGTAPRADLRLLKGSHIVVPRLYDGEQAYILQNPDRRVIFAIPYQQGFTLIGTTEVPHPAPASEVSIDAAERDYLCANISRAFRSRISPQDVVFAYSGIRPLHGGAAVPASAASRDYRLELSWTGRAPLLTVYGGKLTTYRRLAEHALAKLATVFPRMRPPWTASAVLPGGDLPARSVEAFADDLLRRKPFLGRALAQRLARSYGTRAEVVLAGAERLKDLGVDCGEGLTQAEVNYLVRHEFARTVEDVLWRRSKLGLRAGPAMVSALQRYLAEACRRVPTSSPSAGAGD